MSSNRFTKIAHETWDRLDIERGGRFESEDYLAALHQELAAQSADDELLDDYAKKLAAAEERKRTFEGVPGQLDLLTGETADLDSFWKVHGTLIKVRYVNRRDLLAKLAQEDEDLSRKMQAGAKRKREASELLPYMEDPTSTLEEAIRSWRIDHPSV
jgi:hypothetical protein